jgi:phage gp29-like protein
VGVFSRLGKGVASLFRTTPATPSPRPPRDLGVRWPMQRSSGLTPALIGSYTRSADQGDVWAYFELLQEIAGRDPLISGLLVSRLSALSQRPVKAVPRVPGDPRSEEVAAYGQSILDGLRLYRPEGDTYRAEKGLAGLVEALAMASWYGVRVGWVHWAGVRPVGVEIFDERRLFVDIKDESLSLNSDGSTGRGVPLSTFPAENLLEVRATRISPRIALAGAGRAVLFDWWLRFSALKDFASYLETGGTPGLVGTASLEVAASYNSDNLQAFKNFLEDYLGNTRALMPPGFEAKILAAVAGGEAVFEALDLLTEKHIMYALAGQTGTSTGGDQGGGRAGKEVNERVKDDVTEGDGRLVGGALEYILQHATAAKYGAGVRGPLVEFQTEESAESLGAKARAFSSAAYPLKSLLDAGVPVDLDEYLAPYGVTLRADGRLDPRVLEARKELAALLAPTGGDGAGAPPPDPGAVADPNPEAQP